MRGSVYYQTAELTKLIFKEGIKKKEKINPNSEFYKMVSSYKTMESYRSIWNNFFNYLREHWQLKRCELITSDHVIAYMDYKIAYYPSKLYLSKINSALGKLEVALTRYSKLNDAVLKVYDFSKRLDIYNSAVELELVAINYHNRAYEEPLKLINNLNKFEHKLAATIQLEGGARLEGVSLIGDILVSIATYNELSEYIKYKKLFKLKKEDYMKDIRESANLLNIQADGSHGFRWNFAQNRLLECSKAGYTYEQSLLIVSKEMKHNRAVITEHYNGY